MNKRLISCIFLQITTLSYWCAASLAHAEIHKWVDAKGNTHYSDAPPTSGTTQIITPNTEATGVSLSDTAKSSAWKNEALKAETKTSIKPLPSISSKTSTSRYTIPSSNQMDLCEGKVGACFTEQQDIACKLRYGLDCQSLYHWKVCLQKRCNNEHWVDRCDSAFYYLDNRPVALNARDIGRELPLQNLLSESDWKCISQSGFYCSELTDETHCQQQYNQSCDELHHWVDTAKSRCAERRDRDCDSIDTLMRYRPVSVEEAKKAGTINASGGTIRRDLWLESLGVSRPNNESDTLLQPLLQAVTGLNTELSQFPYECPGASRP